MSLHSKLRWKTKLRWKARLSESTARETGHLIALVLNMHLDHHASHARRMVFRKAVMTSAEAEPAIQVVFHWRRFNQHRCHVDILSSSEGSSQDPSILRIANRLRQILN